MRDTGSSHIPAFTDLMGRGGHSISHNDKRERSFPLRADHGSISNGIWKRAAPGIKRRAHSGKQGGRRGRTMDPVCVLFFPALADVSVLGIARTARGSSASRLSSVRRKSLDGSSRLLESG